MAIYFPVINIVSFSIPFSNLFILYYSSFSIQTAQVSVKISYLTNIIEGISQCVSLAFLFILLQFQEFIFSLFTFSDLFLGSIIYFSTGLHGFHVIIGSLLFVFIYWNWIFIELDKSLFFAAYY